MNDGKLKGIRQGRGEGVTLSSGLSVLSIEELEKVDRDLGEVSISGWRLYSPMDLSEISDEMDWLVHELIQGTGVTIVVAKPKKGKTELVVHLALACARGGMFLGRRCKKIVVIHICLEGGIVAVKIRYSRKGIVETDSIYVICDLPENISNPIDALENLIDEYEVELLIIDPLIMMFDIKNENSYSDTYRLMKQVIRLSKKYEIAILLVHHSPKSSSEGADGCLGSSGLFGSVDTKIYLFEKEGVLCVQVDQRNTEAIEPTAINIDFESGMIELAETVKENKKNELKERVFNSVEGVGVPVDQKYILEMVKGRSQNIIKVLNELHENDRRLNRIGNGGRNSPYFYSVPISVSIDRETGTEVLSSVIADTCVFVGTGRIDKEE